MLLHVGSNHCDVSVGVNSLQFVLFLIEVDDRFGLFVENFQSFDNCLLIVIGATTRFAPLKQPSLEFFFSALEVDD